MEHGRNEKRAIPCTDDYIAVNNSENYNGNYALRVVYERLQLRER